MKSFNDIPYALQLMLNNDEDLYNLIVVKLKDTDPYDISKELNVSYSIITMVEYQNKLDISSQV